MSASRKVVVGLGNPDEQYAGTRHNIGWMVADAVARLHDATWKPKAKLSAEVAEGPDCLIAKPTTYMNESGRAVRAVTDFYKVSPAGTCVISDDINLPFGELRFRASGGAGGQKGLKDIINVLGTEDFPRLRVGVGEPPTPDATPHVLGRFNQDEQKALPGVIEQACERLEEWLNG